MDRTILQRLPKVVLHDHLDGGLRPGTVLELAREQGYEGLPADDEASLARWFFQAESATLVRYLEAFGQTLAVMQTAAAIERVAYEAVVDLAADGAVYAELRFGPMLHLRQGLTPEQVMDAMLAGCAAGRRRAGIPVFVIACALRQEDDSVAVAELARSYRGRGVVGFDLAGPEAGFPASLHRPACRAARAGGLTSASGSCQDRQPPCRGFETANEASSCETPRPRPAGDGRDAARCPSRRTFS